MIESKTIDGVPIGKGLSPHLTRRRSIERIKSTGVVNFFHLDLSFCFADDGEFMYILMSVDRSVIYLTI